jgi:hypothetical protein
MEIIEEPGYSKVCHLWVPWMLTNAHTVTKKQFPLIFCTDTVQEVGASGHKLLWEMKPASTIFSLDQNGSHWNGAA